MQPEEISVTSFGGTKRFTIVNDCIGEITDVRLTHFEPHNPNAEIFIAANMARSEQAKKDFTSQAGHHDHWVVTFQNHIDGYMCRDLDESMTEKAIDYAFSITDKELVLTWTENGKSHRNHKAMEKIYDCIKS